LSDTDIHFIKVLVIDWGITGRAAINVNKS